MTDTRRNVLTLFREDFDPGDPWGSTMAYLFPLAEILRRNGECPIEYQASIAEYNSDVPAEYGDDDVTTTLWDGVTGKPGTFVDGFTIDLDAVRYAYRVLGRYDNFLRLAGRNY